MVDRTKRDGNSVPFEQRRPKSEPRSRVSRVFRKGGQEQIRKRLVATKSEDKLLGERKPTTSGVAYEFKRQYDKWVKAGAKGSCPSLILSIFRKPEFDTSFPEETHTKIATDFHKKYRQKNDE